MERINSLSTPGDILCLLGYARREQIDEAAAWRKAELENGRDPGCLSEIFVAHGICTEEQKHFAVQVGGHLLSAYVDSKVMVSLVASSLGSIMVGLGFVERAPFYAAIDLQRLHMRFGRDPLSLQDILVKLNACTQEELEFGLKLQREIIKARDAKR